MKDNLTEASTPLKPKKETESSWVSEAGYLSTDEGGSHGGSLGKERLLGVFSGAKTIFNACRVALAFKGWVKGSGFLPLDQGFMMVPKSAEVLRGLT